MMKKNTSSKIDQIQAIEINTNEKLTVLKFPS